MKEKIYLDSTIPSYYFDQRQSLITFVQITQEWWSKMSKNYDLFISDAVLQELNTGNYPRKNEIVAFASVIPLLPLHASIEQIVKVYSVY